MSEEKRTYKVESPGIAKIRLKPAGSSGRRRKRSRGVDPEIWKIPCSLETVLKIIERIQQL